MGAGTGEAAGLEAGKNIDAGQAVKDAVEAAKEAAEKAALRAKELLDLAGEVGQQCGAGTKFN